MTTTAPDWVSHLLDKCAAEAYANGRRDEQYRRPRNEWPPHVCPIRFAEAAVATGKPSSFLTRERLYDEMERRLSASCSTRW